MITSLINEKTTAYTTNLNQHFQGNKLKIIFWSTYHFVFLFDFMKINRKMLIRRTTTYLGLFALANSILVIFFTLLVSSEEVVPGNYQQYNNYSGLTLNCKTFDYDGVFVAINDSFDKIEYLLPGVSAAHKELKSTSKNYTLRSWLRRLVVYWTNSSEAIGYRIADTYNYYAIDYEYWNMIAGVESEYPYYFCPNEPFLSSFSYFSFSLTIAIIILFIVLLIALIVIFVLLHEKDLIRQIVITACFLLSFCNMSLFLINIIIIYVRVILSTQSLSVFNIMALIKSFLSVILFVFGIIIFSLREEKEAETVQKEAETVQSELREEKEEETVQL